MTQNTLKPAEKVRNFHFVKNNALTHIFLILLLIFNSSRNCNAIEVNGIESNLESVVNGSDLDAIMLAYGEFNKKYIKQHQVFNKHGSNDHPSYSSNINNYSISIEKSRKEKNHFIVEFRLKLNENNSLMLGSGGVTRYLVNPKKHQVKFLVSGK